MAFGAGGARTLCWSHIIEAQKIYVGLNKEYPASQKIKADNLIALWGDFNQDKMNLSVAGKNQADSVSLMQREGYK